MHSKGDILQGVLGLIECGLNGFDGSLERILGILDRT